VKPKYGANPLAEDPVDRDVVEAGEQALLGHAQDAGEHALEEVRVVLQAPRQEVAEERDDVVVVALGVAGVDGRVVLVEEDHHALAVVLGEQPREELERNRELGFRRRADRGWQ
jgi:hypothetical protein